MTSELSPQEARPRVDPGVARIAVLAFALLLLARDIGGPFSGWFEWNSAWYAQFGRNHIEYGLGYTGLYCTHGLGEEPPEVPIRYLNHPPLICAWAALPMLVFGDDEWVARSVPIAATLGALWLLMGIATRLHSASVGVLVGLFYAALPITAYFGRMLDHIPVVQLGSLLMLHGYLQWSGHYGAIASRRSGAISYAVGAVIGIGTGWAAASMAGLIALWHLLRVRSLRVAAWIWLAPVLTLLAVVLHIAAAVDWDAGYFRDLLATRTWGSRPEGRQPWSDWLLIQGRFLSANFSMLGVLAALAFPLIASLGPRLAPAGARVRAFGRGTLVPWALIAVQGLVYVVAFKNQSWIHDYWQFLGAPYVAVSLAALAAAAQALALAVAPRGACVLMLAVVAAPLPSFVASWNRYHELEHIPAEYLEVYRQLAQRIPPKIPVMTSRDWEVFEESFGRYTRKYPQPQIAFHANRPLIHTRDWNTIVQNSSGSGAYVLELADEPQLRALWSGLEGRYETFRVGRRHLVALLRRPLDAEGAAPAETGASGLESAEPLRGQPADRETSGE